MVRRILITGASGALGTTVVSQLQTEMPEAELVIISRKPERIPWITSKVVVLQGELTLPIMGNQKILQELKSITAVIHMAADVNWNQSLDCSFDINARGTAELLKLIENFSPRIERFVHISTAFTDPPDTYYNRSGFLNINGRIFNNSYEYSKWEAENFVSKSNLPWVIVRPSLIVGSHYSGAIARYNGIYHLFKVFSQGLVPFLVGEKHALVDIVPVDTVAFSILAALREEDKEKKLVFAISGDRAPTLEQVINEGVLQINRYRIENGYNPIEFPKILNGETYSRFLYPLIKEELRGTRKRLLKCLDAFHPYLSIKYPFLPDRGIIFRAPPFQFFLPKCIRVWCENNSKVALSPPYSWKN